MSTVESTLRVLDAANKIGCTLIRACMLNRTNMVTKFSVQTSVPLCVMVMTLYFYHPFYTNKLQTEVNMFYYCKQTWLFIILFPTAVMSRHLSKL